MVTLKDIAKLAHVNESTVSRALNGSVYVHPDTKKKVFEAAKKLSYDPDLLRKAIQQGKTKTIGIIIPNLQYNIFMDFVQKAEINANAVNYKIIIAISNDDSQQERKLLMRMRNGLVDGIVITSTGGNNHLLEDIQAGGMPVMQIFRNVDSKIDSVSVNYKQSVAIAVDNLLESGATNLALINGSITDQPYQDKLAAFEKVMNKQSKEIIAESLNEYPKSFEQAGYDLTAKILKRYPKVNGLLVANDTEALGAMHFLKEQKLDVPNQVKVISLAGCSVSSLYQMQVSNTAFPIESISMRALSLLISRIEKLEKLPLQHQVLNTAFNKRQTC